MSQDDVKEQIRQQLKASTPTEGGKEEKTEATSAPSFFTRASRIEVAGFMRQFGILTGAEYPVVRALKLLAENTSNRNLSSTISQISGLVTTGTTLSQAMSRHPWYFDLVTINIIRAAETSGKLSEGLTYLADQYEYDQEIRDKVTSAMTYPAVLGFISLVVILSLLIFIIPDFGQYLQEAGGKVEGMTGFVFSISQFVSSPVGIPVTVVLLVLPVFGLYQWRRRNEMAFDTFLGRVPIFGRIMMLASLTRFVNMMHMLLVNDVKVLQGLDLAKGALGNAYLRRAIFEMHASVEQGKSMAEPLRDYTNFPPIVRDMIAVGEESGKLPEMLSYLSNSMKMELSRTTDRIMVLLQPFMLVFLGTIVLLTFIVFFLPYFELLSAMSRIK